MKIENKQAQIIATDPVWTRQDFLLRAEQISCEFKHRHIKYCGVYFDDAAHFACVLIAAFRANVTLLVPPNLLKENLQWLEENDAFLMNEATFNHFGQQHKILENITAYPFSSSAELWLKTSGSSGEAKIIRKTATQMWAEAFALKKVLPFAEDPDLTAIGSVSVQHNYGLSFRVMLPLVMQWQIGRKQLPYPEFLLPQTEKLSKALWISSPALLSPWQCSKSSMMHKIAGIISSGGALPTQTATDLANAFPSPIIEIYGSTETGVIAMRRSNALWQKLPSIQLGLNNGALWVEGAWMTGRQQTADAVAFHSRGFELLGRVDRIVKLGDKRISLVKIEQQLLTHHWVEDCYIAVHPHKFRAAAWVALSKQGLEILENQGRKYLIRCLQDYLHQYEEKLATPRFWRFCEKLPRNSQSKILKRDFEQIFLQKNE